MTLHSHFACCRIRKIIYLICLLIPFTFVYIMYGFLSHTVLRFKITNVNSTKEQKLTGMSQVHPEVLKLVEDIQRCIWAKEVKTYTNIRSELRQCCDAFNLSVTSQQNTLEGSSIPYDGQPNKKVKITKHIFQMLPKTSPFKSKNYKLCAVVGNSGFLFNSSCGADIDKADFVFRCNLPGISAKYKADVGNKTDLVTANPSIFKSKYANLDESRKPFADAVTVFGEALLLMTPFTYQSNEISAYRAYFTLKDFQSKLTPVFLNSSYLKNLVRFWENRRIREHRLSTGLLLQSMAIELCDEVHLYGFWPFKTDATGRNVSYHYYDEVEVDHSVHVQLYEFLSHLKLHTQGVIRIQLGTCAKYNE
ncbi:alpha-2,8-sialyltransferase 8F-like isoform X2 [Protopterus annectens]|uniref:alpha-2,8-sialyltransferase 8F-like isoform X2 n=1 Tax=Protopterus annectens TaxID=7888 RepID=UPI001CFAF9E4|nr:alpha-2,8-sialyltransferase 8F-like isoform X2 [Protopterus annectens]